LRQKRRGTRSSPIPSRSLFNPRISTRPSWQSPAQLLREKVLASRTPVPKHAPSRFPLLFGISPLHLFLLCVATITSTVELAFLSARQRKKEGVHFQRLTL
ncbi:hypothetical protein V8F06_009634, partial [Rhypophila decipiens]